MAKRNSDADIAGIIVAIVLFLPIVAMIYLFKGVSILIKYIIEQKAKKNEENAYKSLLNTNIREQLIKVDNLEGLQFEKYIGELLKKIGFKNVIVTKGSGDFGADIIAEKDGNKYAFQCKRFSSTIGPKPIGEVLRGMNKYKCNKGVVITNNYFTNQAIQEAEVSNVELWDRDKISFLIGNNKIELIEENKDVSEPIIIEEGEYMSFEENENIKLHSDEVIDNIAEIEDNASNKSNVYENTKCEDLVAGYYKVGEDIEEGKYIIEAISGKGAFEVKDKEKHCKKYQRMGIGDKDYVRKFNNLTLNNGEILEVDNTVVLRFTKVAKKEKTSNSYLS